MKKLISRKTWIHLAVAFLVLTLPLQLAALAALEEPDSVAATEAWVGSLPAAELDGIVENLEHYPIVVRKAAIARLTPTKRAAVWAKHFDAFLAQTTLDPAVRNAAIEAKGIIVRGHLGAKTNESLERLSVLSKTLQDSLGAQTARQLLYSLGPDVDQIRSAEPVRLRVLNYLRQVMVVQAAAPECQCSSSSDWCEGPDYDCVHRALNCNVDPLGFCGTGGIWDCDGLCDIVPPSGY